MISIQNISKRYGDMLAVDNLTLRVETASITGFLGPNGAGKSTALRCLVGLDTPDSGSAHIDGRLYRDLPNPAATVGVMLDASAMHPGRTGLETLRSHAVGIGVDASRIDGVLDQVGLTRREAKRLVKQYSLGMRQRLGLAQALLGRPRALVLDEPVNGLDPQGIAWMRDALRRFADDGGTVLLSSHLLHEVQLIADQIVMIGHGRIVAQGTIDELTADGTTLESTFLTLTSHVAREGAMA